MHKNLRTGQDFKERLKAALASDLPGSNSHLKMASQVRRGGMKFKYDPSSAVPSSVLILLFPGDDSLHTVFILRQTYNGVHSGQVSFPGGRKEPEDRDLVATALREAAEEVNIDPSKVEVLGTLSEMYIPPSNFLVLPVVGYSDSKPDFSPDETEVAEIIETDLEFLFNENKKKETTLNVRGTVIDTPYYDVKSKVIWGATAMILSELEDIIKTPDLSK
jgi:8-oxo-dGTP pyrophosphatase MutT (NUDIX family)